MELGGLEYWDVGGTFSSTLSALCTGSLHEALVASRPCFGRAKQIEYSVRTSYSDLKLLRTKIKDLLSIPRLVCFSYVQ